MSDDRSDGLSYLLFLAATTVLILILVGWFASGPDRGRQIARECNHKHGRRDESESDG
jgi:hypothetical protein